MARAYMDRARAEPALWTALFEHRMAEDRSMPDWYAARIARLFGLAEEVLGPLFAPGEEAACRRSARVLWSALQGMTSLALARKLEPLAQLSAEEMAEDLVATYLAGLTARQNSLRRRTPGCFDPGGKRPILTGPGNRLRR